MVEHEDLQEEFWLMPNGNLLCFEKESCRFVVVEKVVYGGNTNQKQELPLAEYWPIGSAWRDSGIDSRVLIAGKANIGMNNTAVGSKLQNDGKIDALIYYDILSKQILAIQDWQEDKPYLFVPWLHCGCLVYQNEARML